MNFLRPRGAPGPHRVGHSVLFRRARRRWAPSVFVAMTALLASCSSPVPAASVEPDEAGSAQVTEWRNGLAQMYGLKTPPEVTPIREVWPEERDALILECMTSKGFPPDEPGVQGWAIPDAQMGAFNQASYECALSYPPRAETFEPLNDDQKNLIYDYVIDTQIPCLEAKGFVITEVPSRQVFVDTYLSNPFFPQSQVGRQVTGDLDTELASIEMDCPQSPPSEQLYK